MVDCILALPEDTRFMILAPVVRARKGQHVDLLQGLRAKGYLRIRLDGKVIELDPLPELDLRRKHSIEVVVDRCASAS